MSRTTTKIIIAQQDGTVVGQYLLGRDERVFLRAPVCNHLSANFPAYSSP